MTIPTTSLNENTPAGSQSINLGDNRLREYKTQNREILEVDHVYPSSGQDATAGQHKKVTLLNSTTVSAGVADSGILHVEDDNSKGELFYMDEDDNDVQLTSAGKIGSDSTDIICDTIDAQSGLYINGVNILSVVYPVGSIYCNASDNTNPATLLGFGTWTAIEGQFIAGYDSGDSYYDAVGNGNNTNSEAGENTHTLTGAESGTSAHTHNVPCYNEGGGGTSFDATNGGAFQQNKNVDNSSEANASEAHNNLPPYYVVYMWRRTA
jgi:hypothetical protein